MATVYKIEVVSHWNNYTTDQLRHILEDALKGKTLERRNTISVADIRKSV
tara:strand:+ start:5031 stop:5180 length:150 start_codon:yes stop_codon:yes gene_type:complete